MKNWLVYSLLLCLLSSCGYRWDLGHPTLGRPTVFIPFIPGDKDGTFTNEVASRLATSGLVTISHKTGDYRLEIAIQGADNETIGYRFAKEKIEGEVSKNLVAAEARKSLVVEVTFFEGSSDKIAYGPYRIKGEADYDYLAGDSLQDLTFINKSGEFVTVLPFSLGQLEPNEAAQEAATRPLYVSIARKIVDAISAEW